VWLYVHVDPSAEGPAAIGTLRLRSTANQDNPQTLDQNGKHVLLLTIDVWEHAYYGPTAHKAKRALRCWTSLKSVLHFAVGLALTIFSLISFASRAYSSVDYYNQRARFVDAFWSVVNWEGVEATYKAHVDAVQAAQENKTDL